MMRSTGATVLFAALALAGCGGGGGGGGTVPTIPAPPASDWQPGIFLPSDTFAAKCRSPRTGIDPATGQPFADIAGSELDENNFLRSWSDELYLWYAEIVDDDPAFYATPDYFDLLQTFATTASGAPKDRFHFTIPTDEWQQLSQSGVTVGYGAEFAVLSATPPREVVVAYTQAGTPATAPDADLARGDTVLAVNGFDIDIGTQAGVDLLNAALFPDVAGRTYELTIRDASAGDERDVTLTTQRITLDPVPMVSVLDDGSGGRVGYLLFHDHIATAEQALIAAVNDLVAAGVDDLILDLRYNGGGFLDIASELAYMIAGGAHTAGRTFERLRFNDKHTATNPVTGQPLTPLGFHDRTVGFSVPAGQSLPSLDLSRVFVLTGATTCSASEAIINGLRGVGVEVIGIGTTTCGKPYGFYPRDNCGTTYFSIQFQGHNANDFGDYGDGFSPGSFASSGVPLPGCALADDFTRALGDPAEARLAAVIAYRNTGSCPVQAAIKTGATDDRSFIRRSPWRSNRIMRTGR